MSTWIFQGNPDTFDITGYLKSTQDVLWTVRQSHLQAQMALGDRVYLWRSAGKKGVSSGVIAESVLVEEPRIRPDDEQARPFWRDFQQDSAFRVGLRVLRVANEKEMVRREWLKDDPVLRDLRILRLASETNYKISDEHASRLAALWKNTGRDWDRAQTVAGLWAYHRTYGAPLSRLPGSPVAEVALLIGRALQGVYNKVMNFRALDERDPRAGFTGGGEKAQQVWNEFFDPESRTLRVALLEAEFQRLWRRSTPAVGKAKGEGLPLAIIADRDQIARANKQFADRLRDGAEPLGRLALGYQGGQLPAEVFHRADLDLWMAFEEEANRFWNAFGFGVPGPKFTASIVTEINPPYEGIFRRTAGAFATDQDGEVYLVHRGKIGGGRKGVSKLEFLPFYVQRGASLDVVEDGDTTSEVVVIGALGEEKLPALVAAFVHSVRDFKDQVALGAKAPSVPRRVQEARATYSPEFTGRKEYTTKERITADCTHGLIVNTLQRTLSESGYRTANDQYRDLVVVDGNGRRRVLFEIKPSWQPYSVYQAVGQLLYHSVDEPEVGKVAVLPVSAPKETRDRLEKLGIGFVGYEWEGQRLRFEGLADVSLPTRRRDDPS